MIGKGRVIESDLFGIASRLKEIDEGYFIFYRYQTRRLEVHNKYQRGNTLALVLPFERLDTRTVEYVLKTRVENKKRLLEYIEKLNSQREKQEISQKVNEIADKVDKILSGQRCNYAY